MSLNNPEYAIVKGKRYKINTDFRVAIECDTIARNSAISEQERALAIIYKLFGNEGLDSSEDWEDLLKFAQKYFCMNKQLDDKNQEPDMDFVEDMDYIEASFMSDYRIDLPETKMHWWKFYKLLNGLSNSELGNCCILNRIRNLRNFDLSTIKDSKEQQKIAEQKEIFSLKKNKKKVELSKEQEESMERLNKIIGFDRK